MIEVVVADLCTGCGACVPACPSNVLTLEAAHAVIARQDDCQTCFLCELHCPADAIYVAPETDSVRGVTAAAAKQSGQLGRFRRLSGWGENPQDYPNEHWRMSEVFARAAQAAAIRNPPPRSG
jgi:NAD-dependent dihydropyrimidine dehydrogenase PreA subunit